MISALSHWITAQLGQIGGGGGLAFLLPKDSIKASFLHQCGGERDTHTHTSSSVPLLSRGERLTISGGE